MSSQSTAPTTTPSPSPSQSKTSPPTSPPRPIHTQHPPPAPSLPQSWLPTPAPIRRLFSAFPLQTLPANPLPASGHAYAYAADRSSHQLYIFTTPEDARAGAPSFNPTCLKWQTWLKVQGVRFGIVGSSNHASPSGQLPFLIRGEKEVGGEKGVGGEQDEARGSDKRTGAAGGRGEGRTRGKPVTAGKLYDWAIDNGLGKERVELSGLDKVREEAYLSLVEHRLRAAWLFALYLTPNFDSVVLPLYIAPSTSALPVRLALSASLKQAARSSLHLLSPRAVPNPDVSYLKAAVRVFDEDRSEEQGVILYQQAAIAFEALSTLLGGDEWFFGAKQPGLLDVNLFAYTHLLLDEELGDGWADTRLRQGLIAHSNLVKHRKRLYKLCYL